MHRDGRRRGEKRAIHEKRKDDIAAVHTRYRNIDGAVSKLRYTAFRLVPYLARSRASIPVTCLLDRDDLIAVVEEEAAPPDDPDDI